METIPQESGQQRADEQIVPVPVPTVQEQMIEQEIPRAQVVKRIRVNIVETIPQERVQQRTVEQIVRVPVPTVHKQMCVPVNSGVQVMERIPEHIVESSDQEELDQLRQDWLVGALELQNDEDEPFDQEALDQLRHDWLMGAFELQNDEDGRRKRKSSKKKIVKRTAQVMERIPEHTVELFDQEELDQLRQDWWMGALELQNDEDGRRERKSSKKKVVNRTRLKHPDIQ